VYPAVENGFRFRAFVFPNCAVCTGTLQFPQKNYFTAMQSSFGLLAVLLLAAMALSVVLKKLTLTGALAGGMIAFCIYAGAGVTGIALLGTFFILGTAATAFKKDWKEQVGITAKEESKRTAWQVFANGGVASLLGLLAVAFPQNAVPLQVMLAASLASATADTLSSELGVVYGRNFYNIRTLKRDRRGLDGVVSWEGTLLGIAGSIVISLVYAIGLGFSPAVLCIAIAGTAGNVFDSLLGATLERAHRLNNNAVNTLNTAFAASLAGLLLAIF
jgi:uncharacterized protein (TIGR00297 family)